MIVLFLGLILVGAISTAVTLWLADASWGMIALGYFLGGWAGMGLSLPLVFFACRRNRRRDSQMQGSPVGERP